MSENEKLRALLAEARDEIVWLTLYDESDRSTEVKERIDAALAEPVATVCIDCGGLLTEVRPGRHHCNACDAARVIEAMKCERDEARAEIERISAEYEAVCADLLQHKEDRLRLRAENMRLTREAVGAFRAGARAMRDKAADYIKNNIVGDQASMVLVAKVYEKEIRSLPLPEDTDAKSQ